MAGENLFAGMSKRQGFFLTGCTGFAGFGLAHLILLIPYILSKKRSNLFAVRVLQNQMEQGLQNTG